MTVCRRGSRQASRRFFVDRLVHPHEQVVRLWQHWGRPEIVWYRGGHTGFFTAQSVQKFIDSAIVQSGLIGGEFRCV